MIVARPSCALPQCHFKNSPHRAPILGEAFHSLSVKYKGSQKSIQLDKQVSGVTPAPSKIQPDRGSGVTPAPCYKSAGGILRHRTKFGDDRYALVQGHRHKKWSFPKGHLQDNETPYTCALREIAEETGITFLPLPITSLQIGFGYYYIFEVEEEYPLRPRDKDEIMATKWATLQEMRELDRNTDVSTFTRLADN